MNHTSYINTLQHCNLNSESGHFDASDLTCSSFTLIEPARLSVECGESVGQVEADVHEVVLCGR